MTGKLEVNSNTVEQHVFVKPSSHLGAKPNRGKQAPKRKASARKGNSNEEEERTLAAGEADGSRGPEKRGRRKTFQAIATGKDENEMEKQLSKTLPVVNEDDTRESEKVDFEVGKRRGQARKDKGRKCSMKGTLSHKLSDGTEKGEVNLKAICVAKIAEGCEILRMSG